MDSEISSCVCHKLQGDFLLVLLFLLSSENLGIKEVFGSFLRQLCSLKALVLSETGITSLPPCIGNPKHLAFLQLKCTGICGLPVTIDDLEEVQFLDVSFCERLHLRALDISGVKKLSHLPRFNFPSQVSTFLTLGSFSRNDSFYVTQQGNYINGSQHTRCCNYGKYLAI